MIEDIQTMITDLLGPFGPLMIVGLLGVLLILITLPILMKKQDDPLDRLRDQQRKHTQNTEATEKLRTATSKDKLEKYSTFLEPQDEEEYSAVRLKLMQAGYKSKNAVRFYPFAQFALGLVGLLLGGIYAMIQMNVGEVSTQQLLMYTVGPGGAGYMLPKY